MSGSKSALLIIITLLLAPLVLSAYERGTEVSGHGTISGVITNRDGEPVPFATVYIGSLQLGTTTNMSGQYELSVPTGRYRFLFQSLGYGHESRDVVIGDEPVVLNIVLNEAHYMIPEVIVTPGGEDPAYSIMRHAIARAPFYLNIIESYLADVYIKGTLTMTNIPRWMTIGAGRGGAAIEGALVGETYLMETQNEIEFNAPDRYLHRLIAMQNNFPIEQDDVSPMTYIQASFYEPVLMNSAISPLAPNAFAHYRFRYDGVTSQGPFMVNRIEVIPRRESQQLFRGTIHIVEDLWAIQSIDLKNDNIAGELTIRQLHTPVHEGVWMPVTHYLGVDLSLMGIEADIEYGTSVHYRDIAINRSLSSLPVIVTTIDGQAAEKDERDIAVAESEEISELLAKDNLSRREMRRLSRLFDRKAEESAERGRTRRDDLLIEPRTRYIVEDDALSYEPDYWEKVRPVPLTDREAYSLARKDTISEQLREIDQSFRTRSGGPESGFLSSIRLVFTGKTWRNRERGISFTYDGLIRPANLEFNSVDGFRYGTGFRFTKRWKGGESISVYPSAGYSFSLQEPFWSVNTNINYRSSRNDMLWIRAGSGTSDFNDYRSVNRQINSFASLLFKENISRLYHSEHISVGHRAELFNGVYLELSAISGKRRAMVNNTSFSLFRRDREYSPNRPENSLINTDNEHLLLPESSRYRALKGNLTVIPFQRYRIYGGRKVPAGSSYPTFTLDYTLGRGVSGSDSARYNRFILTASQTINTGPLSQFYWRVRGGTTITGDEIPFHDFIHFNQQPSPLLINDYGDAFFIAEWYSLSTNKWFTEAHLKYTSPHLLLKRVPGISRTLMRENLHGKYLLTREQRHYIELGYSISEILLLGEVALFASFRDFRYSAIGARVILKIN